MTIWIVLLLLVSVGLLIAGCEVEDRKGFYAALPLALSGLAGLVYAFYLFGMHVWLPLFN